LCVQEENSGPAPLSGQGRSGGQPMIVNRFQPSKHGFSQLPIHGPPRPFSLFADGAIVAVGHFFECFHVGCVVLGLIERKLHPVDLRLLCRNLPFYLLPPNKQHLQGLLALRDGSLEHLLYGRDAGLGGRAFEEGVFALAGYGVAENAGKLFVEERVSVSRSVAGAGAERALH
jgi:hypothetical protein